MQELFLIFRNGVLHFRLKWYNPLDHLSILLPQLLYLKSKLTIWLISKVKLKECHHNGMPCLQTNANYEPQQHLYDLFNAS